LLPFVTGDASRSTTVARWAEEFKQELCKAVAELSAALQNGEAAGPARGWTNFDEMLFGWSCDPDNRPVSSGARVAVVAREQMLQKGVNFSMFVPAQLDVFLEGKVTRAAGLFSEMKSSNCLELDTVELFTQLFRRHGRRNHTTTEMWRNGTLVLRKRRRGGSPRRGQAAKDRSDVGVEAYRYVDV
jgi:hypothetical protein